MSPDVVVPEKWADQYQRFEVESWHGWILKSHAKGEVESILSDPITLFDADNVVRWHKQKRNRLAEVNWPPVVDHASLSDLAPRTVVLKSYESGSVFNSLRLMRGELRSIRHWKNVWLLNENGVKTPQPVFIALPKDTADSQGLIATATVQRHLRIREIFAGDLTENTRISIFNHQMEAAQFAQICGRYARAFHDAGFVHRDFSGANILIPDEWDGTDRNILQQFVMLDINRIRRVDPLNLDIRLRIQDLERLYMPDALLKAYYFSYADADSTLENQWQKFLKYRGGYRRIRDTRNPVSRGLLKLFTYWPRTG